MALSNDLTLLYRFGELPQGDLGPRYPGRGPTLTHTRASPGTFYNEAGMLMTAVSSDVDPLLSARNKHHDPAKAGLPPGGLIAQDPTGSGWQDGGAIVTASAIAGPAFLSQAYDFEDNNNNFLWELTDTITDVVAGERFTFSTYVYDDSIGKVDGYPGFRLVFNAASGTGTVTMDTSTGETGLQAGSTLTPDAVRVGDVLNGYRRLEVTVTAPPGATTLRAEVFPALGQGADLSVADANAQRVTTVAGLQLVHGTRSRGSADPAVEALLGLLIEDASGNIVVSSRDFDSVQWNKLRSSIGPSAQTLPDGTLGLRNKLLDNTANNTHGIVDTGVKSGVVQTRTNSIYLKAAEVTEVELFAAGSTFSNRATARFDLNSGEVTDSNDVGSYTFVSADMVPLPNGWFDCQITYITDAELTTTFYVFLVDPVTRTTFYPGTGTDGVFIDWAQNEARPIATSRILTQGAEAIRPADVASTTDVSWYNQNGPGTFMCEHTAPVEDVVGGGESIIYTLDNGDSAVRWRMYGQQSGGRNRHRGEIYDSAILADFLDNNPNDTDRDGQPHIMAAAIDLGVSEVNIRVDGGGNNPATTASLISGLTTFRLGQQWNSSFAAVSRSYKELRFYNRRRPDDEAYTGPGTGGLLQLSNGEVIEEDGEPQPPAISYQMLI